MFATRKIRQESIIVAVNMPALNLFLMEITFEFVDSTDQEKETLRLYRLYLRQSGE